MSHDLSPPWTSFNIAMALKIGLLINLEVHRMMKESKTPLLVNNQTRYQQQSYLQGAPTGMQAVFIPASNDISHLVPAIVEEKKLYFNLQMIALMFMQDLVKSVIWDICRPLDTNMHNGDHSM